MLDTKKVDLALVSLVLGIFSFVHLFGLEKALIAISLGAIALKNIAPEEGNKKRKLAIAGIVLGSVYVVVLIAILVFKGSEILKLLGNR